MNVKTEGCDPDRLESFLRGEFNALQEQELSDHLCSCRHCRQQLQQQAAEPESWQEAQQLLQPAGFAAVDPTTPDQCDLTKQPAQIQNVINALAPTDDPAMLGRLGGYEVSGVVGSGGMGVVLKAIDKSLDRTVAIKVLAPHLATSGAAKQRFAREAKAAAAVLHPNVIAIHSVSNDDSLPHLVMPYIRGTSLQKRIDSQGPLPLTEILRIGSQIAAGLAAAHAQGLVHRDIKPANILLEEGVERVGITDFGLARAVDDATITHSGVIAGTPQYMSPEQACGEPLDQRSDLFSLGSVMYAMCTGRPPFRAETTYGVIRRITDDQPTPIREINPDVPVWLCRVISRLMSKDADGRFATAAQVTELLEQCLAHVQQPAATPLPNTLAPASSHFFSKTTRTVGVFVMIAIVSLFGIVLWQAAAPPDIAGKWTGDDWGNVVLEKQSAGKYEGTYDDTFHDKPGTIELKWSVIEQRFNGSWGEGDARHGKISVRLVDGEVRGAWTTSKKSDIHPGNPKLADLLWVRPEQAAHSERKSVDDSRSIIGRWKFIRARQTPTKVPADLEVTIGAESIDFHSEAGEQRDVMRYKLKNDRDIVAQMVRNGELRDVILGKYQVERNRLWLAFNEADGGTLHPLDAKGEPPQRGVSYMELERIEPATSPTATDRPSRLEIREAIELSSKAAKKAGDDDETVVFWESEDGRVIPLQVSRDVLLDESHVVAAVVVPSPDPLESRTYSISIRLTPEGRERFARETERMAKADPPVRLAILVDSKVRSAPRLMSKITGGTAMITGTFTKEEAERLAKTLDNQTDSATPDGAAEHKFPIRHSLPPSDSTRH